MGIFDFFTRVKKTSSERDTGKTIPLNINCWNYRRFHGELLDIDVIVACIDALARNLAKMELTSIRQVQDRVAVTDTTSAIARVLKRPNQYMTMYDFIYKTAALYYASNNAFVCPFYDSKGELQELWPINYKRFQIREVDNVLVARFEMLHNHYYTVPYSQLIPLRRHYFNDPLMGDENTPFGPTAELMHAQNQGIIEGIKSSAIIRGLLKATQTMKEEDINKARKQFIEDNLNATNNGGVLVVDGKFDYKQIDSKPYVIDAETRAETKKAAFDFWGVNEKFLQNSFTAEEYEGIYEGALEPFAIMLCQAMTVKLFTERERSFGNQIRSNMAKLKYQPLNTVANVINTTKELGLFTRDEYREMLGYEPLGPERGGDEIMIAVNNYESMSTDGTDESQEGDSNEG